MAETMVAHSADELADSMVGTSVASSVVQSAETMAVYLVGQKAALTAVCWAESLETRSAVQWAGC